jgi:hypothetical protein
MGGPIPVGLVVVTGYRRGAQWRPRPIRPGAAALALIDNTVAVRQRPRETIGIVKRVVASARAIRSPRGEAITVAPRLLRYLDHASASARSVRTNGVTDDGSKAPSSNAKGATHRNSARAAKG